MFEEFWSVYPRREDKKKARVVWNKLSLAKKKQAIEDCQTRYRGIERCFIPLPTTYLRGERWEDDPIPRKAQQPEVKVSHASHKMYNPRGE